ncbi:MAG: response regulator [Oligoflexia bacterium]|nr:response regulator [Oligoflexia bacterium]
MKILLAEDDPSIQIIAKLTLQKVGGHEVVIVNNGEEAINRTQTEIFDLILLDGMMPVMDGLEACRQLKKNPQTKNIPVIFMTAKNQQSDIDEGFKAGAIGYLVKPFDAKELCNELLKIYNKYLFDHNNENAA